VHRGACEPEQVADLLVAHRVARSRRFSMSPRRWCSASTSSSSCGAICRAGPARQPAPPRAAGRGAAPSPGRHREAPRYERDSVRDQKVGNLLGFARAAVHEFAAVLRAQRDPAPSSAQGIWRHTRADNVCFDAYARVSHATDARTARRDAVRRADAGHGSRDPRLVRACIESGLTVIPRGGGTGYTGSAVPLTPFAAVINVEKLERIDPVEPRPLPVEWPGADAVHGSRRGDTRVEEAAHRAGFVFAVDPTSADASVVGGNIAMNAGGKKAVLWGTALDTSPGGAWSTRRATGSRSHASTTTSKDPRRPTAAFELTWKDGRQPPDTAGTLRTERLEIAGATFRKSGLGKDVTTSSWRPAWIQKEGCDGIITSAAGSCTACRRTSAPYASSSSARRATRSGHRRDPRRDRPPGPHSRRAARGPRAPRRALPQAVGYSTSRSAARCPRCAARRHRGRGRGGSCALRVRRRAHRQCPRGRRLHRGGRRGAQGLLA